MYLRARSGDPNVEGVAHTVDANRMAEEGVDHFHFYEFYQNRTVYKGHEAVVECVGSPVDLQDAASGWCTCLL